MGGARERFGRGVGGAGCGKGVRGVWERGRRVVGGVLEECGRGVAVWEGRGRDDGGVWEGCWRGVEGVWKGRGRGVGGLWEGVRGCGRGVGGVWERGVGEVWGRVWEG